MHPHDLDRNINHKAVSSRGDGECTKICRRLWADVRPPVSTPNRICLGGSVIPEGLPSSRRRYVTPCVCLPITNEMRAPSTRRSEPLMNICSLSEYRPPPDSPPYSLPRHCVAGHAPRRAVPADRVLAVGHRRQHQADHQDYLSSKGQLAGGRLARWDRGR